MSKLTDKQFDEIFRNQLLDMEKAPPSGSWSLLSKEVAKNNFLHFGWTKFNIFHLAGISVLSITGIIYLTISNTSDLSKDNNPIPEVQKKYILLDSASESKVLSNNITNIQEIINLEEKKSPTTISSNPTKEERKIIDTLNFPLLNTSIPSDTTTIVNEVKAILEPEKKKDLPKQKTIITVIKRDTLKIKDTIALKRYRRY